jgi:hypothetical protein
MDTQPQPMKRHFLTKEESFMYDKEQRFPMEDTMNAARIEFTEKGVMHLAARRCDLVKISRSEAIIGINTEFTLPKQFYLDVPDARISRVGCMLMKVLASNVAQVRFLRLMDEKELDRIFVYSTHPKHRNRVLDLRA